MFALFAAEVAAKLKYGIMMDAGSSGTRAYVYKWDSDTEYPQVEPAPDRENSWEIEPDYKISDAAKDDTIIPKIFKEIIDYTKERIPVEYHAKTNVYIFATAGMRLLPLDKQEEVMHNVYLYMLKNSPYKIKAKNIRVIPGKEEGIYGWLSVNHLLGNLQNGGETEGALDLGGASFQIAFKLDDADKYPSMHTVTIGKRKINIFSHSYLGYGVDVSQKTIAKSIFGVTGNNTIESPCYPLNYKGQVGKINVIGTGDFDKCVRLTHSIMVEGPDFELIDIPFLSRNKRFTGMANLHYANSFFELPSTSSLADLKEKASKYCSTDWSEIAKDKTEKALKYAKMYCYAGAYQYSLLTKGFNFNDESTKITKTGKIEKVALSWTIGAMLAQVGEIEIDEPTRIPLQAVIATNVAAFVFLLPLYIYVGRRFRIQNFNSVHQV